MCYTEKKMQSGKYAEGFVFCSVPRVNELSENSRNILSGILSMHENGM